MFSISCLWRPNITSMSIDFWHTPGYSPWPIALIIYKQPTRQRAIISHVFCGQCPTLQHCRKWYSLWPSLIWPTLYAGLNLGSIIGKFNPSKCKIVTILHKKNPPQRKYVFWSVELEQVGSFPYLGVWTISNKLKWSAHKSFKGIIQCNLWNCPRNVREIAYSSLVRPKLEYASAARNWFSKKDISALKRVQHKAAW